MKKVHEQTAWQFVKSRPKKLVSIALALVIWLTFMIHLFINYGGVILIPALVTVSAIGIIVSAVDPQRKTLKANIRALIITGKIKKDDLTW